MIDGPPDLLDRHRREAKLSHSELWMRYFQLGGMCSSPQLQAFLDGALEPSDRDHDIIAHAINERFVELGGSHPVPYTGDDCDR